MAFEVVALTDETLAMRRILSFEEDMHISEIFEANDGYPVLGMSQVSPVNADSPFNYDIGWRDVINDFNETVNQRARAADPEVVWSTDDTFFVPRGTTLTIEAVSDQDPFLDAIVPVKGSLVYVTNRQTIVPDTADYVLSAGTVNVTLSRTSGQSVKIMIHSTSSTVDAVIKGFRLRAYPVRVVRTIQISNRDIGSVDASGLKSFTDTILWANHNDMFALSEVILNQRFKRLPVIHFNINNETPKRLRECLEAKLSDRIRIQEFNTATNEDYFVEQIAHSIQDAGNTHYTMIGCEQVPAALTGVFTFNDPSLGFNQGVFADRSNLYHFEGNLFILDQSPLGEDKVLGL